MNIMNRFIWIVWLKWRNFVSKYDDKENKPMFHSECFLILEEIWCSYFLISCLCNIQSSPFTQRNRKKDSWWSWYSAQAFWEEIWKFPPLSKLLKKEKKNSPYFISPHLIIKCQSKLTVGQQSHTIIQKDILSNVILNLWNCIVLQSSYKKCHKVPTIIFSLNSEYNTFTSLMHSPFTLTNNDKNPGV